MPVVCGLVVVATRGSLPSCGFQQQAITWFSQLPPSGNVGSVHGNGVHFWAGWAVWCAEYLRGGQLRVEDSSQLERSSDLVCPPLSPLAKSFPTAGDSFCLLMETDDTACCCEKLPKMRILQTVDFSKQYQKIWTGC